MRTKLRPWAPKGDAKLVHEFLPSDTSRQTHAFREAVRALKNTAEANGALTLLDLGCGNGASYDAFVKDYSPRLRWIGLDILDSQEVAARTRQGGVFCGYDGVRIPLKEDSIDLIYSRQVFEHVRHPELLIQEAYRVLRPGAIFVGSTSHLEPFHSRSYWNYTPYGFCVLLRDAGFRSIIVRPGIDSVTLIGRRFLSYFRFADPLDRFFQRESPVNMTLEIALRILGQPKERRTLFKLLFAGQFCFQAVK